MKITKKRLIIIVVILILTSAFILLRHFILYSSVHVQYNGEITKYKFDIKGYGYFQIDNGKRWYEMHHLNCDLNLGDSMVKKMDDGYIYHYRDKKLIGVYGAAFGVRYK